MSIEIGSKILLKRTEKKYSQEGLSKMIHIQQSRLSDIENGIKSPTWQELENISKSLEINIGEILPANTMVFNCNSHDTSHQYNGNITISIPKDTIKNIIKDIIDIGDKKA
jgi:transcriptional regulator with XRE-family HTH domain